MQFHQKPTPSDMRMGFVLSVLCSLGFFVAAIGVFLEENWRIGSCAEARGKTLCEIGGWMLAQIPVDVQALVFAGALALVGVFFFWLSVRLLRESDHAESQTADSKQ